jgi:hypothetical protein
MLNKIMKYKIIFPTGYQNIKANVLDSNIDVNIVFDTGDVYFGILATTVNVQHIMQNNNESYFWVEDLFIVKGLDKETIRKAINKVIELDIFYKIFTKIGVLGDEYFNGISFEYLPDMNNRAEDLISPDL